MEYSEDHINRIFWCDSSWKSAFMASVFKSSANSLYRRTVYGCNLRLKKPMICAVIAGAVGGGIMGVVPGVMGVAAFAPPLDDAGNSVKAQAALSDIVGRLNLNIFHPRKSILAEQA